MRAGCVVARNVVGVGVRLSIIDMGIDNFIRRALTGNMQSVSVKVGKLRRVKVVGEGQSVGLASIHPNSRRWKCGGVACWMECNAPIVRMRYRESKGIARCR